MKKLFLSLAVCTATLLSASTGLVVEKSTIVSIPQEEISVNQKEISALAVWDCVYVTFGCGTTGWACGNSTFEIIMNAWNAYDAACEN